MTSRPMEAGRRSDDEIRRDLATEEGRGSATRQSPTGRLVADVPSLLEENSALQRAILRNVDTHFELSTELATACADAAEAREQLAAIEHVINRARNISTSPSMTVYVGDLDKALGRRRDNVRGIVGASDGTVQ